MKQLLSRVVRRLCLIASRLTEPLGFVLTPLHYYHCIPGRRELARRDPWSSRSHLEGIDWNEQGQLQFLEKLGVYGTEATWPVNRQRIPERYSPHAPSFGFASAMLAHACVRVLKPQRIIEIGCGWSTLTLLGAVDRNEQESGQRVSYLGIDPFAPDWLPLGTAERQIIRKPLQDVDWRHLVELEADDILFVDSTHVLNIGSDVQRLYLEIIPRIAPGVVVHIHDIQMPWEYPREYAMKQQWFWTEQYLLQAFLTFNREFEILAAGQWLTRERTEQLKSAFPHYHPTRHAPTGSFWMRRRIH